MGSVNWNELREQAEKETGSSGNFPVLPEGEYAAEVVAASTARTSTNKDMIKVQFKVVGGPYDNRRVFTNLTISPESPQAMAILFRHLDVLGARTLLDSGATVDQVAGSLAGATATVKLSVGEYKGEPKNEVKDIKASSLIAAPQSSAGTTGGTVPTPF